MRRTVCNFLGKTLSLRAVLTLSNSLSCSVCAIPRPVAKGIVDVSAVTGTL